MRRAVVLGLFAVLCAGQSTRSVSGTVRDAAGNTLPGTVVQCENTVNLNIQSYVARADGGYVFRELSSDVEYVVRAHYKRWWSKPVTLSKFNERREARIDLVIPVE